MPISKEIILNTFIFVMDAIPGVHGGGDELMVENENAG
jgi:hypothetical protein